MITQPVVIESNVDDADVATNWTMETVAGNNFFYGCRPAIYAHIEIKDFLPHGNEETSMPLLTGVFLCDLQFDCCICFLQSAEQGRDWLPDLKVNRSVFNLHNDVVIKLAIQRMKDVVSRSVRGRSSGWSNPDGGYKQMHGRRRSRCAA